MITELLDLSGLSGLSEQAKRRPKSSQPYLRLPLRWEIPPGPGDPYPEQSLQILSILPPFRRARHRSIMIRKAHDQSRTIHPGSRAVSPARETKGASGARPTPARRRYAKKTFQEHQGSLGGFERHADRRRD